MSGYQQKEGDIVVYKVKEKRNEKGPDFTGKALINGEEKDVAFWIKGTSGTMLAGTIKPKFKPNFDEARQAVKGTPTKFDDDLPW
jgi:hypothetical protein